MFIQTRLLRLYTQRKKFFRFVLTVLVILLFCERFLFNPNPASLNTAVDDILSPSTQSTSSVFLVIFVISYSSNFLERDTIRKTWANRQLKSNVLWRTIFLLGKPSDAATQWKIQHEADENGDILQGNFMDTKTNLPLKTTLLLRWASRPRSQYILKTDDDMYVNIARLINWLKTRDATHWLYAGKVRKNATVVRFRLAAYPVAYVEFPDAQYPYYCYGGFYILSGDMIPNLIEAHRKHLLFPVEDAFVGVLTRYIGVKPTNIYPRYLMLDRGSRWRSIDYRKCKFAKMLAFGDSIDSHTMFHIHKSIENLRTENGLFTCTEQ